MLQKKKNRNKFLLATFKTSNLEQNLHTTSPLVFIMKQQKQQMLSLEGTMDLQLLNEFLAPFGVLFKKKNEK